MVAGERTSTRLVMLAGGREVAVWRLEAPGPPDLGTVEAVALVRLAARRRGWSVELRDPCPALVALLDLLGLAGLFEPAPGLRLEAGREPEGGEQLGVEEVVEPGDPAV